MDNISFSKFIQFPSNENKPDFAQQSQPLVDEIFKLRQINEEMTNMVARQKELIQQLKDEIAILKGQKPKPKIEPSRLENRKPVWHKRIKLHDGKMKTILFSEWVSSSKNLGTKPSLSRFSILIMTKPLPARISDIFRLARQTIQRTRRIGKPGQPRGKSRKKKTQLEIHNKRTIDPVNIPEGAVFKGFNRFTVQDIVFEPRNTLYQMSRWELPDGSYIAGELPKEVQGHYGPELIAYVLHQYYTCRVTEHLLLDQLRARGVLISAGKLSDILTKNKDAFIAEVAELLPAAIEVEKQIQVDDTGGRHNGKNQYTTIIGNCRFSVFVTTDSKSRVNFLKLLQGGREQYVINGDTIAYLHACNAADYLPGYLSLHKGKKFNSLADWENFLKGMNITRESELRFVTEAALFASLFEHGIPRNLLIHSDDAGQFDIVLFFNTLCWIHEERHYRKLIMTTDEARADLERVKGQIWEIYQALKAFKESRDESAVTVLEKKFDDIFQQNTSSALLNHRLKTTYEKKQSLLGVLKRPETPLHNNASETDARAAKIKLKISGGTRSSMGQKARDTFLSLQQTCLKLGINFYSYLQDRVRGLYCIPRLAIVIREQALAEQASDIPNLLPSSLDPNVMILCGACSDRQLVM